MLNKKLYLPSQHIKRAQGCTWEKFLGIILDSNEIFLSVSQSKVNVRLSFHLLTWLSKMLLAL